MKLSDFIVTHYRQFIGRSYWEAAIVEMASPTSGPHKTQEEAVKELLDKVKEHLKYSYIRRYKHSPSGETLFVLYHQIGGWCYDIIRKGNSNPSTTSLSSRVCLNEATLMMERHASEYVEDEARR